MKTALLILGKETSEFAQGGYNTGLWETARETLKGTYNILTTVVEDGYDPVEEIEKFKKADVVIYQHPVFWFGVPGSLKTYIDAVYAYGEFFSYTDGPYGSGGLMQGKKILFSTTWNAPDTIFNNPASVIKGASLDDALIAMRTTHLYCGFEVLPPFGAFDVIQNPNFERDQARFVDHLTATLLSDSARAAE